MRFADAYDCVRETREWGLIRKLCHGLELKPEEVKTFRTFVAASGFERNNSSGIVYPLLAAAVLSREGK